jgi:hypothetical protein
MYWENGATLNVALLGMGTLLMTSSATVGRLLYNVFGRHNLEQWVGAWCFLGAIAALILHTQKRRTPLGARLRSQYEHRIVAPFTLAVPISLAVFWESPGINRVSGDGYDEFLDTKIRDGWAGVYWLGLAAMFCYLGVILVKGLLAVRRDARSRRCANFYLAVIAWGVATTMAVMVTAFDGIDIDVDDYVIPCTASYTTFLALIAATSWRRKQLTAPQLVA